MYSHWGYFPSWVSSGYFLLWGLSRVGLPPKPWGIWGGIHLDDSYGIFPIGGVLRVALSRSVALQHARR